MSTSIRRSKLVMEPFFQNLYSLPLQELLANHFRIRLPDHGVTELRVSLIRPWLR